VNAVELVFKGLVGLTLSHLKEKEGQTVTLLELGEAMHKAGEDMKEILRKAGLRATGR
jgi:hypothetical protein